MKNEAKNEVKLERMERTTPRGFFNVEWLSNYAAVQEEGEFKNVSVLGDPFFYDPFNYGKPGNPRWIVNLRAIDAAHKAADLEALIHTADGNDGLIKIEATNGMFLTGSMFIDLADLDENDQPIKPCPVGRGSKVDIRVEKMKDMNGQDALRVTSIIAKEKMSLKSLDLAAIREGANQELPID